MNWLVPIAENSPDTKRVGDFGHNWRTLLLDDKISFPGRFLRDHEIGCVKVGPLRVIRQIQ